MVRVPRVPGHAARDVVVVAVAVEQAERRPVVSGEVVAPHRVGADAVHRRGVHARAVVDAVVHGREAVHDEAGLQEDVAHDVVLAAVAVDAHRADVARLDARGVPARRVVAEERLPAHVAVGGVGADVRSPVAFEEVVVREGTVVPVDRALVPRGVGGDDGLVHVVVPDHVPAAARLHHQRLVERVDDVVFDQVVGALHPDADAVGAAAGVDAAGMMDVRATDLAPVGVGERDVGPVHARARRGAAVRLDVPDPAVGHVEGRDVAVVPSRDVEVLQAHVARPRLATARGGRLEHLRRAGRVEGDVDGSGQAQHVSALRDHLDLLADRTIPARRRGAVGVFRSRAALVPGTVADPDVRRVVELVDLDDVAHLNAAGAGDGDAGRALGHASHDAHGRAIVRPGHPQADRRVATRRAEPDPGACGAATPEHHVAAVDDDAPGRPVGSGGQVHDLADAAGRGNGASRLDGVVDRRGRVGNAVAINSRVDRGVDRRHDRNPAGNPRVPRRATRGGDHVRGCLRGLHVRGESGENRQEKHSAMFRHGPTVHRIAAVLDRLGPAGPGNSDFDRVAASAAQASHDSRPRTRPSGVTGLTLVPVTPNTAPPSRFG